MITFFLEENVKLVSSPPIMYAFLFAPLVFWPAGDFAAALLTLLEPLLLRTKTFEEVDAVCALAGRRIVTTRDLIEYFQLHIAPQAAASQ
jgi:hypothetical protein